MANIIYNDDPWANNYNLFSPQYALFYQECEVHADKSYYLTRDKKENQMLIIDFGCTAVYSEVIYRNPQNGFYKDRYAISIGLAYHLAYIVSNLLKKNKY